MRNSLFYNAPRRIVLFEKTKVEERSLEEILISDYGFHRCIEVKPKNFFHTIKAMLKLPYKEKIKTLDNWLYSRRINGNAYYVYFDMWDVELTKNSELIFCARRFENEEFLKLID